MTVNLKVNSKIIVSNNIILNVVKSVVFTRKEKKTCDIMLFWQCAGIPPNAYK